MHGQRGGLPKQGQNGNGDLRSPCRDSRRHGTDGGCRISDWLRGLPPTRFDLTPQGRGHQGRQQEAEEHVEVDISHLARAEILQPESVGQRRGRQGWVLGMATG